MADFFDDLSDSQANAPKKPFFEVDLENDAELKDWFQAEISFLRQESQFRFQKIKNNYSRYKGIQYRDQIYTPRDLPQKRIRYMPQMVIPIISDVIDEKTARLLEFKPAVVVIPEGDEHQDKSDAKIAKKFLSHIDQQENSDEKFFRAVRSSKVAGESFMFILWDPDKGEIIEGTEGKPYTLANGKEYKNPVFQGDIKWLNETALNVLYEKCKSWDETSYLFHFSWEYTDGLKRDHPGLAQQIKSTDSSQFYDYEKMEDVSLRGKTLVITFYNKVTKYMPQGFECKFTPDIILKKGPLSYEDGELPCVRLIDVENEEEQHGEAQLEKIRSMASQYNNINNMIIKQEMLCSHPKWAIDAGSVDEQSLNNDVSIIKMKPGSRKPELLQANPVSPQLFEHKKELKQEFYEMAKSNSIVRGEPPPGVTAFVALQFISESENRRSSQDLSRVNNMVKAVYQKTLNRAAQFYKPEDERTMMILGKDNNWLRQDYKPESLKGPYSVQIQSASSLPDSKALRTQYIIDLGKQFPDLFPDEQLLEMMGLAQSDKFLDEGTAAARSAEAENEIMFEGDQAPEPEEHEYHIIHWRTHVRSIQDINFKLKTPPEVQQAVKDHIMATERLMFEQIYKSSSFAAMVNAQCPMFPMFYTPDPITEVDPLAQMKAQMMMGGAPAPGGEPPQQAQGNIQFPEKAPALIPGDPGYSATQKRNPSPQQAPPA